MNQTCESCGARLGAGAEVCDLCGTPVDPSVQEVSSPESDNGSGEQPEQPTGEVLPETEVAHAGVSRDDACRECGHGNPAEARFCNQCGARLDTRDPEVLPKGARPAVPPPAEPESDETRGARAPLDETDKAVGKQVMIVVSAALLLVVVLYAITAMSGGSSGDFSIGAVQPDAEQVIEPLASQWTAREAELKAEVDAAVGDDRIEARRRLIDLYFAADRLDFAAEQTALIASATSSEQEWILAGNLYFDWMQRAPDTQKAPWAREAVAAYQEALALNPDNIDVRTDMAIAYLYDPQNSMMAIQETNRVLEQDSLHVQANFNRGIMLSQINRVDQAIEQFEKVKRIIGDPDDPVYIRAQDAIARLSGS